MSALPAEYNLIFLKYSTKLPMWPGPHDPRERVYDGRVECQYGHDHEQSRRYAGECAHKNHLYRNISITVYMFSDDVWFA
jgi:hypothetical protein